MLNLSVAQIAMAMHEGEDSVDALTSSFTDMVSKVQHIAAVGEQLPPEAATAQRDILDTCQQVQGGIQHSIVAFQFYDRLSQRLDHVKAVLEELANLVADGQRVYKPEQWSALQQHIRARYTMKEEQEMFDILLAGASVNEALDTLRSSTPSGDGDDIELF